MRNKLLYIIFFLGGFSVFAQEKDSLVVEEIKAPLQIEEKINPAPEYDPLAPSRAAFYSAVIPGLGQAYNKKYWKIPIVYAGIGSGIYFYKRNDDDYNRFRNAYKRRLAGYTDDEFYGNGSEPLISNDRLINAQRSAQKNKSLSLMVSLGFYLLNIIDANVDAHLQQYEMLEDLSLQPMIDVDPIHYTTRYGLQLTFRL